MEKKLVKWQDDNFDILFFKEVVSTILFWIRMSIRINTTNGFIFKFLIWKVANTIPTSLISSIMKKPIHNSYLECNLSCFLLRRPWPDDLIGAGSGPTYATLGKFLKGIRGKSLLESRVTTLLPGWQPPLIFVRFISNFLCMCSNSMDSAHVILK